MEGLPDVLQQIPRAVTGAPPSEVTVSELHRGSSNIGGVSGFDSGNRLLATVEEKSAVK